MKIFLTIIFVFFVSVLISQTVNYRMTDMKYFKYPVGKTLEESLDSSLIEYDSLKYKANTLYTIDKTNGIFSYVNYNGVEEIYDILNYIENSDGLVVQVDITNKGIYQYYFKLNIFGDMGLIVIKTEPENNKMVGFFTGKLELVNYVITEPD